MTPSNPLRHALAAAVLAIALHQATVLGFSFSKSSGNPTPISPHGTFKMQLQGSVSKWNEEYQSPNDDEEEGLITNEQFMRDMLSEPAKRRKKGSREYKSHDNRDALPFVVRVKTPDPYTPSGEMLTQAKKNSAIAKNQTNGEGNRKGGRRTSNLVGMDSKYANAISASIYSRKKDGSLYKVLGQFELDKNTNCGDLLQVGEREFEVVTARSQFK